MKLFPAVGPKKTNPNKANLPDAQITGTDIDRLGVLSLFPSKQFHKGEAEEDGTSGEYYAPQGGVDSGVSRQFTVEVEKGEAEQTENDGVHAGDHVNDGARLVLTEKYGHRYNGQIRAHYNAVAFEFVGELRRDAGQHGGNCPAFPVHTAHYGTEQSEKPDDQESFPPSGKVVKHLGQGHHYLALLRHKALGMQSSHAHSEECERNHKDECI